MPNLKSNKREIEIFQKYKSLGYECLTKGYPDFCFFNDKEVFFVEVKKLSQRDTDKHGLSKHQKKMIELFKRLGLKIFVEYI